MFTETPDTLILVVFGALLLGWVVGKVGAFFGDRFNEIPLGEHERRIRSLEADQRVSRKELDETRDQFEKQSKALSKAQELLDTRDLVIKENRDVMHELRSKLKTSVKKTRQLRAELSERATEDLKSTVRLRDVETELSVVQATTELISTGVLDFSDAPEEPETSDQRAASKR